MSLQRTGRAIVYTNQVPYEADILRTNMYRMTDIATIAQTVIGGDSLATQVYGGACTQAASPDLTVQIAPISIYQLSDYDATDYGVIPLDTDQIYKQAMNLDTTIVSGFVAPGSGTRYYLIQAKLVTNDVNTVNRPYYNSANPAQPIFNSQPDTRVDSVFFQLKFSSVSTPTPDSGYVGLYAVTVTNGQTTITNGDISIYADAPFLTGKNLPNMLTYQNLQQSTSIYAVDSSGAANTITATTSPVYTSLVAGTHVFVKAANSNTGATSINLSALGATAIRRVIPTGLSALVGGEIIAGVVYELLFDGSVFQILNPSITEMPGVIKDFAGTSIPAGYLACIGGTVSQSTYAALYAVLGATWGSTGGGNFTLPDFRRRTAVGSGGTGTSILANTTGSVGGEEGHIQTLLELAAHEHELPGYTGGKNDAGGSAGSLNVGTAISPTTTDSAGSSNAMNIMQPSAVVTKIIRA